MWLSKPPILIRNYHHQRHFATTIACSGAKPRHKEEVVAASAFFSSLTMRLFQNVSFNFIKGLMPGGFRPRLPDMITLLPCPRASQTHCSGGPVRKTLAISMQTSQSRSWKRAIASILLSAAVQIRVVQSKKRSRSNCLWHHHLGCRDNSLF